MAISFVAAGTVATGTNPSVPAPAGIQQGDLLVIAVAANVAVTTPTGWTLIGSQTTTPRIYLYRKFATGTETSQAVTVGSATTVGVMLAYRGVSATDTVSTGATATSTTISTNTLTTTYGNEYVVSVYGMTTGAATWTAPASTTTRVNSAGTAALDGLLFVDELQATAGTSTARTATSSVSKALAAISFSIIPSGRYWISGNGVWDTTTTSNWSFSSGGTGGAPVPTLQDNVYFDQSSTVNISQTGALTCFDLNVTAGAYSFNTGSSPSMSIAGSLNLSSGTLWTSTNIVNFTSTAQTRTITTNGVNFQAPFTFNGVGGYWSLNSALTIAPAVSGAITLTNGTFDLNGYTATLSAGSFAIGVGTKNLTFNGGTLAIGSSGTAAFSNSNPTNFTTTAGTGTGTISLTSASAKTFVGAGSTFACTLNQGGAGTLSITGANTFNNITATYTATAASTIRFPASTITNVYAFTGGGTSATFLLTLNSATAGTKAIINYAGTGVTSLSDYFKLTDLSFTPFITDGTAPFAWYVSGSYSNSYPNTTNGNVTGVAFCKSNSPVYAIASGTSFTVPANWNNANNTIYLYGAGGGGSGGLVGAAAYGGSGGGGGGFVGVQNQTLSGTVSYSIGAGGTGGAAGGSGGLGGSTTFSSFTAPGGAGGTAGSSGTGGAGGIGSGGATNATGGKGGNISTNLTSSQGAAGGGGGGSGGYSGAGKQGGQGSTGTSAGAGGGGGGSSGGTVGGNASGSTAGTGGNGSSGTTGGGGPNVAGTFGGGGGGSTGVGAVGGVGYDLAGFGAGGGAGGNGSGSSSNNTAYGGGGGGGMVSTGSAIGGGAGASGLILVTYTLGSGPVANTASFFFMY